MRDRIEDVLKAVREADSSLQAPGYVETRLRAAFREHHGRAPRRGFSWWWAGAPACAAAVLAFSVWRASSIPHVPAPSRPVIAFAIPNVPQPRAVAPAAIERPRAARPKPETLEFTALPYAPPLMPYEQAEVIRVRLPRQSLRDLGITFQSDRPIDRIPAEILMGEDGVARGIRYVSYR